MNLSIPNTMKALAKRRTLVARDTGSRYQSQRSAY